MPFTRPIPTLTYELAAWRQGARYVAGVDEAGRGPMAGPLVAGAAVLDPEVAALWWSELRDSKVLTAAQRSELAVRLRESVDFGVGIAGHDEIDDDGLTAATHRAMVRALGNLARRPEFVLIDAVTLPQDIGPQRALIDGDAICVSIAAASIIAKVERDRLMDEYDRTYPHYGFARNRGYCTPDHLSALSEHGPCPIHRRSFAPVRIYLEQNGSGD
ncbi:MAG: ribonuclease HII [Dehalococcoidia bacterium]